MRTTAIVFPFDLFGNSGTGAGAELLGDVLREIVDDTRNETRQIRPKAYAETIKIKDYRFETLGDVAAWRAVGRQAAKKALATADFLLWLAGNHLGVLPLLEELPPDTLVLQLDAHLDIYNLHDCTPELSHGNFLRHAERLPRLVNIASRDLFLTDKHVAKTFDAVFPADRLAADFNAVRADLHARAAVAPRLWLDLDADALDPAYLPAVCQPLPFGLLPAQLLAIVQALPLPNLLGVSVSEFAPGRDIRDASLNLLGWFIEWLLEKKATGTFDSERTATRAPSAPAPR